MLLTPTTNAAALPRADDVIGAALAIPADKGVTDDSLKAARILIIDDEPLIVRVVSRFLQSNGFEHITSETDPRKATLRLAEFKPDLVLLDIMMPFVDGLDVLRRSRHNRVTISCR